MDLVNTVRKEGSRGGRGDFKWTDVQADQHRENYLGHSVMAPVGRWQKGRDLQWYARNKDTDDAENDGMTEEERIRKERQDEIARIKQAEREAMNKALGYEVNPDGPLGNNAGATGANATAVVGNKAADRTEESGRDRKREHRQKRRHASRERDRERRTKRYRDRSRSRSRERKHRDDHRSRSRSREYRERKNHDPKRTRRSDDTYQPKRENSLDRRRRSRSLSNDPTKHRISHRHRDRSESRSPYRQPFSRDKRKEESHRRQRSRSP